MFKGPAAATLYGTEAARGVINIITKKGAAGSTKYSFTVKGGTNWFMDAAGRIPTNYCNSFTNSSCKLSASDTTLYSVNVYQTENARGTPLFRDGGIHNYAANVSGGSPLFRFFASGEWNGNQGVDYANERIQQSARTNLSVTPNEKFELESSVGYIKSKTSLSCEAGCGGTLWGSLYSNPVNTSKFCVGSTRSGLRLGTRLQQLAAGIRSRRAVLAEPQSLHGQRHAPLQPDDVVHQPARGRNRLHARRRRRLPAVHHERHDRLLLGLDASTDSAIRTTTRRSTTPTTTRAPLNFNVRPTLTSKTAGGIQYYTNYNTYFAAEGDHFPAPGLETITAAGTKIPASSDNTAQQHARLLSSSRNSAGAISCSSPARRASTTTARSARTSSG